MKSPHAPDSENGRSHRLLELLADRAVFGLDPDEERELAVLLSDTPEGDDERLDRIAAAVAIAHHSPSAIESTAPPAAIGSRRWPMWAAVFIAACGLSVAAWPVVRSVSSGDKPAATPRRPGAGQPLAASFAHDRDVMLQDVPDAIRLSIGAQAPSAINPEAPEGDIVWSPSRQRGFLRVRGLPPNDPRRERYAVWIIAGRRAVPIRGGSFDIPPDGGGPPIVVPIVPHEFVRDQTLFAITVENSGEISDYSESRVQAVARVD